MELIGWQRSEPMGGYCPVVLITANMNLEAGAAAADSRDVHFQT